MMDEKGEKSNLQDVKSVKKSEQNVESHILITVDDVCSLEWTITGQLNVCRLLS